MNIKQFEDDLQSMSDALEVSIANNAETMLAMRDRVDAALGKHAETMQIMRESLNVRISELREWRGVNPEITKLKEVK